MICISTSVASAAFACGGVDSDLFSDGIGGGATDASTDARNTTRDSGRSDAGNTSDGGIITPVDSGGPKPGQVVPAVCGSSTSCNSSNPTCCATQGDGLTTIGSYGCSPSTSSCTSDGKVPVSCRDNTDCGGATPNCCGELVAPSAQGGYRNVICEATCVADDDAGTFTSHVPFCTVGQLPDVCAPWGLACQPSTILPGFNVCGMD